MAFDQNSVPKDLRPLNIVRNVPEDPRIAPVTLSGRPVEGFYTNQPTDIGGSPSTMPAVYYPATMPDPTFVPLQYSNAVGGVTGWVQHVVPSQPQSGLVGSSVISPGSGYNNSPNFGTRVYASASDHASDDDSVSGRKIKFLCSFGGKILPRLSDGALRYVGGQTRIISVKRDVSFGEFIQKMADTSYVSNVVIKYQLPDEDLDALVSVSCPDDFENMMDEYEKLCDRSSDGSTKLRIFLFSPSELETASLAQIGDLQDGGQRYVEAVNGIMDGFSGRIARKESIESGMSAQNSDVSANEGADSLLGHVLGEVVGLSSSASGLSPKASSVALSDTTPRLVSVNPNPVSYADPSTLNILQGPPGMSYPPVSAYVQSYVDPHQENMNHANFVQLPSQMGYPGPILGPVRPVFTRPPQQFVPAAHMTMNPAFVQPQHVRMEHYPAESMVAQGYNARQPQVPAQGGVYSWHQIPHPEQIAFSETGLSPQPVTLPEKIPRLEDCHMCQKALPHAHSDTIAQEQKEIIPGSTMSDLRSIYSTVQFDGQGRPMVMPIVTENNVEQLAGGPRPRIMNSNENLESGKIRAPDAIGVSQNVEGMQYVKDKGIPHMASGVQYPYGVFVANTPQSCQANPVQNLNFQPQLQVVLDGRPLNNDFSPVGMPIQTKDYVLHESPKEYVVKVDEPTSTAAEHLRKIDERLENLRLRPSEVLSSDDHNKTVGDHQMDDVHNNSNHLRPSDAPGNTVYLGIELSPHAVESISPGPSYGVGDITDNSTSLFSNQDPWNMRPDTHFPPPKPSKIQIRKDTGQKDSLLESPLDDGGYQHSSNLSRDFALDQSLSNKGSAEELIKQELQAVAEGVAASVLHSSVPSNPDVSVSPPITQQNGEVQDKLEEIKTKLSEKINLGFPASGMGRLQIIRNSDLEELRELGSGTFGTVYHGKWRGTDVAIKRINERCFAGKASEQDRMRDDFWNEAIKLADLHHPNVVAFYGVVLDGPDGSVATVTEYMVNGSLRNSLQKNERNLDKRKRLLIGMDVAFGMEYLHGKNIVHFDLKSDNLLVNLRDPHRPICKVGDLGLSKVKCQTLISGGVRGTLPWMAPELLNGSSSLVSEKVDVFSFGIVMWELLTGEEPYADLHYGAIIGGIVSNTLRPPVPEPCDSDWRALMERCWSSEPSERPNFTEIANELRAMATNKPPPKGQAQQQLPSNNPQVKS
ncbi:serine/threonine-protein kinase ctr1 [Phtheirospermum japonicum]|uniref:Serine/threonine-protein kinase ctr1 n=1 Tax=Phtheirospermum japonicum TaxID=374723 RepID=A0A830BBT3_9LAMI|nr:serine/threonine-protein kinase ctr1 [Phtheirospermum japonicum]